MAAQPRMTIQAGSFELKRSTQLALRLILIGIVGWIAYLAPPLKNWPMWVSAAGWIAFSTYWAVVARKASEAKSAEPAKSRRMHELLVQSGLLLLFIPVPGLRRSFFSASAAWDPIGLAVQASFCALALWARRHLGRNWSGRIEIKRNHELVRSGPYRLLRHPIYTAMLGMCVGTALVDGQAHALVGVAIVAVAYIRKIRMEEATLHEAFGAEYDKYRLGTWGFVPGLF